jgi:hypothetical protein
MSPASLLSALSTVGPSMARVLRGYQLFPPHPLGVVFHPRVVRVFNFSLFLFWFGLVSVFLSV